MADTAVPWIVAPRLALARQIALALCAARGRAWDRLSESSRAALLAEGARVADEVVRLGAGVAFQHPWREGARTDATGSP